MGKRALITGVTGQDGSYLAELLITKGYEVWGLVRRASSHHTERIDHLYVDPLTPDLDIKLHLLTGDLLDTNSIRRAINISRPDEIYNLAAQSHVRVSFEIPEYTADSILMGTINLLEAIRELDYSPRYYQASSSEMYGKNPYLPYDENSEHIPVSPYGIAKSAAYRMTQLYREAYGVFACNGILFNHESPRRGPTFVTRKVTIGIAKILAGKQDYVFLGNLKAKRDWGYAPEYVEAMWKMLQCDIPDDYVIATGETFSVEDFVAFAFGFVNRNWRDHIRHNAMYDRPSEVNVLRGNPLKAERVLGWKSKTSFAELIKLMVESDLVAEGLGLP